MKIKSQKQLALLFVIRIEIYMHCTNIYHMWRRRYSSDKDTNLLDSQKRWQYLFWINDGLIVERTRVQIQTLHFFSLIWFWNSIILGIGHLKPNLLIYIIYQNDIVCHMTSHRMQIITFHTNHIKLPYTFLSNQI